jgi:asparagine synthase (glutamine-hydrolysing)
MAHSIEARSPFLDHRLSDFAFSLNHNIILSGNSSKPILRELAGKLLPKQVVVAPKRGFEIPLVYWIEEKLYEMIYATCLRRDGLLTDLFETKELKGFLSRDSISDKGQWAKRVWILFMLALWDEHN